MGRFLDARSADSRLRLAMAAVLLAGAAVRLWEYLGNASLWIDELALSESILHRSLIDLLLRPLALGQSAPAGFLVAVKLSTMLLGTSELALRVPSLLFTLASLPLFAAAARRYLSGWAAVFATALFAFGWQLFHYSAEVKQYAGDVMVAALLLLVAFDLSLPSPPKSAYRRGAVAGALGVWFSMPAAFVVA
ncbi:MAG TPA: glycosyltransferase family 39 protein, partial [Thermoanaerobaculia bacterium]